MEGREWRTGRPHQSCGTAASPELRTAERPAQSGQMFPANGHTVTILGLGVSQLNCAPQNSRGRTKSQHLRMRLHLEETSSKQLAKLHLLAWAPIHHDSCPREKSRTRTMAEGRPCAAPGLHTTEGASGGAHPAHQADRSHDRGRFSVCSLRVLHAVCILVLCEGSP